MMSLLQNISLCYTIPNVTFHTQSDNDPRCKHDCASYKLKVYTYRNYKCSTHNDHKKLERSGDE